MSHQRPLLKLILPAVGKMRGRMSFIRPIPVSVGAFVTTSLLIAALDPLQKLFGGGGQAGASTATPSSQPPTAATPSSSGQQAIATPRTGGLPPFRNASNAGGLPLGARGKQYFVHLELSQQNSFISSKIRHACWEKIVDGRCNGPREVGMN